MDNLFQLQNDMPKEERYELISKHRGTPFFYELDFRCLNCNKILKTRQFNGDYCSYACRVLNNFKKRFGGIE